MRTMDKLMVLDAMAALLNTQPDNEECDYHVRRIEDERNHIRDYVATPNVLFSTGGQWLGTLREWIKQKALNGEEVTWGSEQHVRLPPLTVADLEYFAAKIAAAAINEYKGER